MFKSLLLAMVLVGPPPMDSVPDMKEGIRLAQEGDHAASEKILKRVKSDDPAYVFYRLVNNFKLNKKNEATKWAEQIEFSFTPYPQRYKDLAKIMQFDMETWKHDADDLDDIAREMDNVQNRLKNQRAGKETQKMQDDILKRLAKMIKDREDAEKKAQEGDGKGEGEEGGQDGKGGQSARPANDTHNGQDSGTGEVDKKRVKEIAQNWGKLPEKERAKVMQELRRKLPAKDLAIMDAYIREMAKRSRK